MEESRTYQAHRCRRGRFFSDRICSCRVRVYEEKQTQPRRHEGHEEIRNLLFSVFNSSRLLRVLRDFVANLFCMHYELTDRFEVPATIEQTWAFFTDAQNLSRITPPWLKFTVATTGPIQIQL